MNLVTPRQMAKVLNISVKTLLRYVDKYSLPYYGYGRTRRFDEDEILACMKRSNPTLEVKKVKRSKYTKEEIEGLREIGLSV